MRAAQPMLRPAPDSFAVVMATGILSIAARQHGFVTISQAMGLAATLGLVMLTGWVAYVFRRRSGIPVWDLTDPDVTLRMFTFVAACAVLDSRLQAYPVAVVLLGAVAFASWLPLTALTVRNIRSRPWRQLRDRARGAWELGSVGTSGLAMLAAEVAGRTGHTRWVAAAVAVWLLALGGYAVMTWLILWRKIVERARRGFTPDSWILMGAMAIATLAGDVIRRVASRPLADVMHVLTVATWLLASAWIPILGYFLARRIRRTPGVLRYRGVWWATVFPLGMYSAATASATREWGLAWLQEVSLLFFWTALGAWTVVAIGALRRLRRDLLR